MVAEDQFYYGNAENKLNSKGQVAIPARFRLVDSEEDRKRGYVLVRGEGKCIYMYTHRKFASIKDNARKVAEKHNDLNFYRRFMSEAQAVELDTQGRFVLPNVLMRAIGIKGPSILFAGIGERIEIWDPGVFGEVVGSDHEYEAVRSQAARDIFQF